LFLVFAIFRFFYNQELKKEKAVASKKRNVTPKSKEDILRQLEQSLGLPSGQLQNQRKEEKYESEAEEMIEKNVSGPGSAYKKMKYKKLTYNSLKKEQKQHARHLQSKKYSNNKMAEIESIEEIEPETSAPGFELDFDAKKAVIFSEILKRPQY
jgi:hypothetical protein